MNEQQYAQKIIDMIISKEKWFEEALFNATRNRSDNFKLNN
jgi:hypothetical protein